MLRAMSPLRSALVLLGLVAVTSLLAVGGCTNNSPPAGEACTSVGGVCVPPGGNCGESMPYPCAGNDSCCRPQPDGGAE
jgi:hypothetical protein